jgi:hypothetical protein
MTDRTDSHTLSAFLTTLVRAVYALPAPGGGSLAEHKRQAGHLFPAATAFVFHTLSALERHPDLYPDLRGSAPGIREHQDRADAWLDIETLALNLARLARQHHAREQAQAIIQSKEVLARVCLTSDHPDLLPGVDHDLRRVRIFSAYRVLHRHLRQVGMHRALARQRPAAGPDQPAPAPPRPKRDRADARGPLLRLFGELLRGGR